MSGNATAEFAEKANQLKNLIDELCDLAPQSADESDSDAMASDHNVFEEAKRKTCEAAKKAAATMRRHPMETTAVVVGVGLLAWWLLSRKE